MPANQHLHRLDRIWNENPIFFVTTCTRNRNRQLDNQPIHEICREVWKTSETLYGWFVGRYVLMPDHVHFFCAPVASARPLSFAIGKWKEWTSKYASRRCGLRREIWQPEFFDHVLRSGESYEDKWNYVRQNPVRAGLAMNVDEWPFQGEMNDLRFLNCG